MRDDGSQAGEDERDGSGIGVALPGEGKYTDGGGINECDVFVGADVLFLGMKRSLFGSA